MWFRNPVLRFPHLATPTEVSSQAGLLQSSQWGWGGGGALTLRFSLFGTSHHVHIVLEACGAQEGEHYEHQLGSRVLQPSGCPILWIVYALHLCVGRIPTNGS